VPSLSAGADSAGVARWRQGRPADAALSGCRSAWLLVITAK